MPPLEPTDLNKRRGTGQSISTPKVIKGRERQRQAIELRVAGLKLSAIATQLGYHDEATVHRAIMHGLMQALREPADQLRELSVQRCDRMLQAVWPRVLQGDLTAIGMALRVEQRRATLLGLDAPQQIDLTVYVQALARAAGKDETEALAEVDHILAHAGRHLNGF